MTNGLHTALNHVDESIVALYRERERLVTSISADRIENAASSPFRVPFAVDIQRPVKAFEHFVPGMWFGYDVNDAPTIHVTQTSDSDDLVSPPDHHFIFAFHIENAKDAPWVTLEKTLNTLPESRLVTLSVASKAWSSVPAQLRYELSIPMLGGKPEHRVDLGVRNLGTRFDGDVQSFDVDLTEVMDIDPRARVRLIAFLPQEDVRIAMAYYTVLLSPR